MLKKFFRIHNLDNPFSLRGLTEQQLNEVEKFVANDLSSLLEPSEKFEHYFGMFRNNPKSFRFLSGVKTNIFDVITYVNSIRQSHWNKKMKLNSTIPEHQTQNKSHLNTVTQIVSKTQPPFPNDYDTEGEKKKLFDLIVLYIKK